MLTSLKKNHYLIRELVSRDVRSRYVGSLLGIFWSVLNPLVQLILYTVVFGIILKIRFGEDVSTGSFAEFLFCALLPWVAIQESTVRSAVGFIEHSNLIKKMHFPLETIPSSLVFSAAIHQLAGTSVFLIVLLARGSLEFQYFALVVPLFAVQIVMMLGLAMLISALNVFFRDVAQVIGVAFMLLFWMTPIVYPKAKAEGAFQLILDLNPLTHMVEWYRFAFFGSPEVSLPGLAYWVAFSLMIFVIGRTVLTRTRRELVDLL
ncbi:MAG TPA: ABC transporter permease [Acidobacteriota bacterium]|nr:ABC transporter permease [Acidobacteriota bacterium]